jgi:hypothetical protein
VHRHCHGFLAGEMERWGRCRHCRLPILTPRKRNLANQLSLLPIFSSKTIKVTQIFCQTTLFIYR